MRGRACSTLTLQGSVVRLSTPGRCGPAKRGACEMGGSRKSLRRLSLLLGAVDWSSYKGHVLFLTLTLPDSVHRAECLGPALDRFRKWLLREYPEVGAVARIEQGGRTGRLHAHALIFGAGFIPAGVLRQKWRECLRCPEVPRVGIEAVKDGNRLALYLRKYVAKLATAPATPGAVGFPGSPAGGGTRDGGGPGGLSLSTSHIRQKGKSSVPSGPYSTGDNLSQDNDLTVPGYVSEEGYGTAHLWRGRVWQVWGRERIRYAKAVVLVLGPDSTAKVQRILRRLWRGYAGSGSLFVQPRTVSQLAAYLQGSALGTLDLLPGRCHLF